MNVCLFGKSGHRAVDACPRAKVSCTPGIEASANRMVSKRAAELDSSRRNRSSGCNRRDTRSRHIREDSRNIHRRDGALIRHLKRRIRPLASQHRAIRRTRHGNHRHQGMGHRGLSRSAFRAAEFYH